jgi:hypothetical protein
MGNGSRHPELPEIVQPARVHGAVGADDCGVRASRGDGDCAYGQGYLFEQVRA